MNASPREHVAATVLGILAILIWGSIVAAVRSVGDQMGVIASAAVANLAAGIIGSTLVIARGGLPRWRSASRRYLFGCGGLFVLYQVALYAALGLSRSHTQAVYVMLVNYLWPALTLVLAVPILGKRARLTLWPGLLMALGGVFLAMSHGSASLASPRASAMQDARPYLAALVGAVTWALYSNLSRRWGKPSDVNAVPIFLLGTGAALCALLPLQDSPWRWPVDPRGWAELAYLTLGPTLLAYVFWDVAMRRGHIVLVGSLSFLVPLISTVISGVYLHVAVGADLWLACGLVIAGAIVCKRSVVEPVKG